MSKIAFVSSCYESVVYRNFDLYIQKLIEQLMISGINVEVLTTCSKTEMKEWGFNYYKKSQDAIKGVLVRRFKIKKRSKYLNEIIDYKIFNKIPITEKEEDEYMRARLYSQDLLDYITLNSTTYNLFVFIDYSCGLTYWGSKICPEKSVLIPFLNDNGIAYLDSIRDMFSDFSGVIFNSLTEEILAKKLYDFKATATKVLCFGITPCIDTDVNVYMNKYKFSNPFIIFNGTDESNTNIKRIIALFLLFKERNPKSNLSLVWFGIDDNYKIPEVCNDFVHNLGVLSEAEQHKVCMAADILWYSSKNPYRIPFLLKGWALEKPVIMYDNCIELRNIAIKNNCALYYSNYIEFEKAVLFLQDNKELALRIGQLGKKYIVENHSLENKTEEYIRFFNVCVGGSVESETNED